MSEKKKPGRPKGSKNTTPPKPRGVARNIYFKPDCEAEFQKLLQSGKYGDNDSSVVCAAIHNLSNPPTDS